MAKFPFTAVGIIALQDELYLCDDNALFHEAAFLCDDMLGWLAAKFDLNVHQLEGLRSTSEHIRMMWGISLAQAILCRRPFTIGFYGQQKNFDCFILESSITFRYDASQEKSLSGGEIAINFEQK